MVTEPASIAGLKLKLCGDRTNVHSCDSGVPVRVTVTVAEADFDAPCSFTSMFTFT